MICIIGLASNNMYSQTDLSGNGMKLDLSVDLASGFVWRGMALNTTPVVQPAITITAGKLSIGTWTSAPFSVSEYKELDFFATFQLTSFFSIGISDYYAYDLWNSSFFNLKKEETNHSLDFQLMYEGKGNFPLKAMASTIIGGSSDLKFKDGKMKRNFSTYLEVGYGNTSKHGFDWEVLAGMVLMKSEFYGISSASIINLGLGVSKTFEVTSTYSLPLSLILSINPTIETVFLTAAIALF